MNGSEGFLPKKQNSTMQVVQVLWYCPIQQTTISTFDHSSAGGGGSEAAEEETPEHCATYEASRALGRSCSHCFTELSVSVCGCDVLIFMHVLRIQLHQ